MVPAPPGYVIHAAKEKGLFPAVHWMRLKKASRDASIGPILGLEANEAQCDGGGEVMDNASKGVILRGFENGYFKKAVLSYLKENCPVEIPDDSEIPVSFGLQVIRKFIEARKSGLPSAVPAGA